MYCLTCGRELEEGFLFCDHCGAPVPQMNEHKDVDTKQDEVQYFDVSTPVDNYMPEQNKDYHTQPLRCTSCGTEMPEGSLFCDNCGARIQPDSHSTENKAFDNSTDDNHNNGINDVQDLLFRLDNSGPKEAQLQVGLMRCPYCGEMIDDDSAFCEMCGKPVAID